MQTAEAATRAVEAGALRTQAELGAENGALAARLDELLAKTHEFHAKQHDEAAALTSWARSGVGDGDGESSLGGRAEVLASLEALRLRELARAADEVSEMMAWL